jgi:hypothetical protein
MQSNKVTMLQNKQVIKQTEEPEEVAEMELWVQHAIEQEEEDKHDLQILHEVKQEEESEVCPGHEYEYLEPLNNNSEPDVFKELWVCILCNHTKVMTHHVGIRD